MSHDQEIPPIGPGAPLAVDLLRTVLEGLELLLAGVGIAGWRDAMRTVLDQPGAAETADAYLRLSAGSASGTFHDLTISLYNGHRVTEDQEPWVNELLATFQSIGLLAARAISDGGASAPMPTSVEEAAARHAHVGEDVPPRTRMHVNGMRCTTCDTRFMLDSSIDWTAARRWSLFTAPARIATQRSASLVAAAISPATDPDTRASIGDMRLAVRSLKLPEIRLPYNRADRGPTDPCPVCGAVTWTPVTWQLEGDPLTVKPVS